MQFLLLFSDLRFKFLNDLAFENIRFEFVNLQFFDNPFLFLNKKVAIAIQNCTYKLFKKNSYTEPTFYNAWEE